MKILITGAGGMLGTDLTLRLGSRHEVIASGRRLAPHLRVPFHEVDLAEKRAVYHLLQSQKPEVVLHAAAMTEVDLCESERRQALTDNFDATRNVAEACNRIGALLIFFSTDFVFDGNQEGPYLETDAPHPLSVYGETKLLGERYVCLQSRRFLILRTSWLFGAHGDNFPKKILRQAEAGKAMRVVQDESGNPTYTVDLAEAVEIVLERLIHGKVKGENEIFHAANEGTVSRVDFARAILRKRNFPEDLIFPVEKSKVHSPAARPRNSALSTEKLKSRLGVRLRSWEEALGAYLQEEPIQLEQ